MTPEQIQAEMLVDAAVAVMLRPIIMITVAVPVWALVLVGALVLAIGAWLWLYVRRLKRDLEGFRRECLELDDELFLRRGK